MTTRDICGSCVFDYSSQGGAPCCDWAFYSNNGLHCDDLESLREWNCSGCECPSAPECIDCLGSDCSATLGQVGDGSCDDAFDCVKFRFDGGDCGTTSCLECDVKKTTQSDGWLCCDDAFYTDGP